MADVTIGNLNNITPSTGLFIPASNNSTTGKVTLSQVCGVMTSAQITTALGYTPYNGTTNPNGYITANTLPAGCILQVKQVVKTDVSKTNSNVPNYEDIPGLSINITPKASSSKILVTSNLLGSSVDNSFVRLMRNVNGGAFSHIYTNTNTPGNRTLVSMGDFYNAGSPGTRAGQQNTSVFLDSPNTTSVVVYKLQYATRNGSDFAINTTYYDANQNYQILGASSITLMEVAG